MYVYVAWLMVIVMIIHQGEVICKCRCMLHAGIGGQCAVLWLTANSCRVWKVVIIPLSREEVIVSAKTHVMAEPHNQSLKLDVKDPSHVWTHDNVSAINHTNKPMQH